MKKAKIVGFYKTGINQLDESVFQLPLEDARELLGLNNQSQQLIVMLKDWRKSGELASRIRSLIPDASVAVTPWTRIGDYYRFVHMSETILGHTGVDLTALMTSMKMPMDNVLYPRIGIPGILGSLILGTLVSALMSLLPSRQAARMNAVEAIKSV
jgi:ABC-type lipoprotein release transport system permease subunit